MNQFKFDLKKTNVVGLCAAILAFIFSFVPFYKVVFDSYLKYSMSSTVSSIDTKTSYNLVSYNFFGALFFVIVIALIVLYVLQGLGKSNVKLDAVTTGISILALIVLLLAIIVGNSDIKDAKEMVEYYDSYSLISMSDLIKFKVGIGFVVELILAIVLAASYWIDVVVVKPMVFKITQAKVELNPFAVFISSNAGYGAAANAQYTPNFQAQGQSVQPQVNFQTQGQSVQPQANFQAQGQSVQPQQNFQPQDFQNQAAEQTDNIVNNDAQ